MATATLKLRLSCRTTVSLRFRCGNELSDRGAKVAGQYGIRTSDHFGMAAGQEILMKETTTPTAANYWDNLRYTELVITESN